MAGAGVVRSRWRRAVTGASLVVGGAALSCGLGACGSSGAGTITASARFTDVADLVDGAPVQYANISVGNVTSISLSGDEANVVMTIERSAQVPADVTAELSQSSILGQHLVSLVAPSPDGPLLQNGAVISRTAFVPGIQQLVESGAAVFGAINGAQLSQIINNGAEGFGGQAANLRALLNDFDTILAGYSTRSGQITSLIDNLDAFNSTLGPNAQQDAQAVSNLAQTTQILAQQSSRFEQLLQSLNDLATQGNSILSTGLGQTEDQINALSAVATQLYEHQRDLATILEELPGHNKALASLTVNNYAQILEDIIVCGIPGGGGTGSNADSTCTPGGGG